MIRVWVGVTGIAAMLAGCSPGKSYSPFDEDASGVGINISGTAVTGVAGGSGQSPQMVSGIKDLDLSVGVSLGGN